MIENCEPHHWLSCHNAKLPCVIAKQEGYSLLLSHSLKSPHTLSFNIHLHNAVEMTLKVLKVLKVLIMIIMLMSSL